MYIYLVEQQVDEPLSVDGFLNSIGLGKYSLAFKREEVDMTTIKQMKESDLKDLIIPMVLSFCFLSIENN
jgi:hypothetical protein